MKEKQAYNTSLKVFISYAWGGESERIAQEVEKALTKKGLQVVRDKSGGLEYKGLIRAFMQEIGKGNFVVVIISDKYLRSENCMFEMIEIAKNGDFSQRIYPIILDDAKIYKSRECIKYLKHWEVEIKELKEGLAGLEDQADATAILQDLSFFKEIRKEISELTGKLKNMNTLTPEMHSNSNFQQLYEQIEVEMRAAAEFSKKEKVQVTEDKEAIFWKETQQKDTIAAYENYLNTSELNLFKAEALKRKEKLEKEKLEVNEATSIKVEDKLLPQTHNTEGEQAQESKIVTVQAAKKNYIWLALPVILIIILLIWQPWKNSTITSEYKPDNSAIAEETHGDNPILKETNNSGTTSEEKYDNGTISKEKNTKDKTDKPSGAEWLEMVYIEGGSFSMGQPNPDIGKRGDTKDEQPVHEVKVNDFYMGKYEVTQAQWYKIMDTRPSYFKNCDNCPVDNVSWDDIQEFLKKLNQETGQNYRLPTEAEWEYAARGGKNSQGYKYAGSNVLDNMAWYSKNSANKTHSLGQKAPNALGLYDMSGNVWEWCEDWYGENYYASSPNNNPKGPDMGRHRVLRGGSWIHSDDDCRVASRYRLKSSLRYYFLGFRLVQVL